MGAAGAFTVPESFWLWGAEAAQLLSQHIPKVFHCFWAQACLEVEDSSQLILIRGIPYLLDDSLLMMALTGRIEFRSFLPCSIRHDCADTERWEAGGLWITHSWPTATRGKKENMKRAQLSGVVCTSANWVLMALNLIFSWTALATLFLSNGSERQEIAVAHWVCSNTGDVSYTDAPVIVECWWQQNVTSTEMFTFHTYVFVSPLVRTGLGQSPGLSNRDHLLIPPARHRKGKHLVLIWLKINTMTKVFKGHTSGFADFSYTLCFTANKPRGGFSDRFCSLQPSVGFGLI